MKAAVCLSVQGAVGGTWKSFELIYYDPAAKPDVVSPFNVDPRSAFTTEMRMEYLRRYAHALLRRTAKADPKYYAFDVVSAKTARARAAQIKEKPSPKIRETVPLKYWRWELDPEPKYHSATDVSWIAKHFGDEIFWNAMTAPRMFSYDRAVLLRTHFQGPRGRLVLLSVGSIIDVYEIWLNGQYVCRHQGSEPVTFNITRFVDQGADNTLALRIENKPHDQVGIADDIYVSGVSNPYLSDVFIRTDRARGHEADVTVEVTARAAHFLGSGAPSKAVSAKVEISPWFPVESHKSLFSVVLPVRFSGHIETLAQATLHLRNVNLWSPDAPHLYLVRTTLQNETGRPIDDDVIVTGFRQIEARGGQLLLNGRPWFMKSFGDNLGFAPAYNFMGSICPPDAWIIRDLMLAKEANANTIRVHPWGFTGDLGHYSDRGWPVWGMPNSATNYQRIAWIADQLGIGLIWGTRVWTIWGGSWEKKYAYDDSWQSRLVAEVRHVRNRPSILVYEGLNEVSLLRNVKTKVPDFLERRYEQFCQRYYKCVNRTDSSCLVIPDTPWGPLEYSPFPRSSYSVVPVPAFVSPLYTSVRNTIWTDHNYFGWYSNLPERPLLGKVQARPFVLDECGAEAMPDWRLYGGLRWNGIWLNNARRGVPAGKIEQQRLGRPLRILRDSEVSISQAYQGLSIVQTALGIRFSASQGMNVNLLADGLAEGEYHKGVCDLYRRAKLGYFAAQMAYQPVSVSGKGFDFLLGRGESLHLKVAADSSLWGKAADLLIVVVDDTGKVIDRKDLPFRIDTNQRLTSLGGYTPPFVHKGFYLLRYAVIVR